MCRHGGKRTLTPNTTEETKVFARCQLGVSSAREAERERTQSEKARTREESVGKSGESY